MKEKGFVTIDYGQDNSCFSFEKYKDSTLLKYPNHMPNNCKSILCSIKNTGNDILLKTYNADGTIKNNIVLDYHELEAVVALLEVTDNIPEMEVFEKK